MNLKNYYEGFAEAMPENKIPHIKRVEKVIKYFKEPILDVGCSKGYDTKFFYEKGFKEIYGCDISKTAIKSANKKLPKHFFIHNFEEKKTKKKFNTIYCFDVIEHLFYTNEFLENIYDSLLPEGKLIIFCPNVLSWRNRIKFLFGKGSFFIQTENEVHIRFFCVHTLKQKLEWLGFNKTLFFNTSKIPFMPNSLAGCITCIAIA